jgi:hypothetical protein
MNWSTKALGVGTATAALLGMSATGAAADRPEKVTFSVTVEGTNTSLCGFPIEFESEVSGFELLFSDKSDDLVRIQAQVRTQDTFSANGVTLVGERYRVAAKLLCSDGELIEYHANGVLEKVRLPDGSTFMGAGRVDILAALAAGVDFIIEPDSGVLKNQDAFCATLSG